MIVNEPPAESMSDEALLKVILHSNADRHEKAAALLTVRTERSKNRQNVLLLVLTVVASLSTMIQAIPIIVGLLAPKPELASIPVRVCPPDPTAAPK